MTRDQKRSLSTLFVANDVSFNVPMSEKTVTHIGGCAESYIRVKTIDDVKSAVRWANEHAIDYHFICYGSKSIIRDGGLNGLVVDLEDLDSDCHIIENGDDFVSLRITSSMKISDVLNFCDTHALTGIEGLALYAGSIGGAVMQKVDISDSEKIDTYVTGVSVINRAGKEISIRRKSLKFDDKRLKIPQTSYLSHVCVMLKKSDSATVKKNICLATEKKKALLEDGVISIGPLFQNVGRSNVAALIDDMNLCGIRIGGARVSDTHGNFIINEGQATANHIVVLMNLVRDRIKQYAGIVLEPRLKIVGK